MNKIIQIAASASLSRGRYVTPTANVVEVITEGLLCGSTLDNSHEGWGEENLW